MTKVSRSLVNVLKRMEREGTVPESFLSDVVAQLELKNPDRERILESFISNSTEITAIPELSIIVGSVIEEMFQIEADPVREVLIERDGKDFTVSVRDGDVVFETEDGETVVEKDMR